MDRKKRIIELYRCNMESVNKEYVISINNKLILLSIFVIVI